MKLREFEELAREYWEEIPEDYKRGIDGVRVLRRSKAHDELPDVYTMGECLTEAYPSDFGGPDTTRSAVVLYHGSFAALAHLDPEFDWEDELWETLTHELQHHLESLANEDALEDVDYAADENFRRYEGEAFDPLFFRAGHDAEVDLPFVRIEGNDEPVLPTGWLIEGDLFFELEYAERRPPQGRVAIDWAGVRHAFEIPAPAVDVLFVAPIGLQPPRDETRRIDGVTFVFVRRKSGLRAFADTLLGRTPTSDDIEVEIERIGDARV